MFRFILLSAFLLFSFFSAFSQVGPDIFRDRFQIKERADHRSVLNPMEKKQGHRLKMGEPARQIWSGGREIPIQTSDGINPTERELATIKNVLVDDFLVNDDATAGKVKQHNPSIAIDGSGNFVIVWLDARNTYNDNYFDIYFQRYNSSGVAQGVNTKANDEVGTIWQTDISISMDGSGNFVIVWKDGRNGDIDIYFQRYNSSGVSLGVNKKVNDDVGTAFQADPSVSMDGEGNFVIVWVDGRNYKSDIYYQRYNSNGVAQGKNQKANIDVGTVPQFHPSIMVDATGNFVIVWIDGRSGDDDIYYQRYNSSGVALGVNTKVNDDVGVSSQYSPSISMDGRGNFVIVWEDERDDKPDIYYQRYNSSGVPQGVNTKVNDDVGINAKSSPSIALDGFGNFVIVWMDGRNSDDDNGDYDIYYQRYNSSGVAQGVNTKANDDVGTTFQGYPFIAMDGNDNFIIVWEDGRDFNSDIYYQAYNSSGVAQGVNTKANDDVGEVIQREPSIAMDGSGNFVIVWEDWRNYNSDIYYQRYNSSGVAQGVNTKANDDVGMVGQYYPSVSIDKSGNFVIAWMDERNGNYDVYFQRYNSSGVAQGVNTKANDDVGTADQWSPSIAMNVNGNFVVVWRDYRNGDSDIYFQRYNSSGVAQGVNTKVNDDVGTAAQWSPSIAMDDNGNFVIVWMDLRNGIHVYLQRFDSTGLPQGTNLRVDDYLGRADLWAPSISMDRNGNTVIVWIDDRNGLRNSDIYLQRYDSTGIAQGANLKVNDDVGTVGQYYPSVSIDKSGNFVVVWMDYRYGLDSDIIGQRYDRNGSPLGTNYLIVADGPNDFEGYPVVAANESQIVFSWMDNRRSKGSDIYAKIVGWDWDGVTSVLAEKNIPTEFALIQNYPNPFNPKTTIEFTLPVEAFVTLKVYNVLAQEVVTLADRELFIAGRNVVEFDAGKLTSGVYFCRITAEGTGDEVQNFTQVKKMLLIR